LRTAIGAALRTPIGAAIQRCMLWVVAPGGLQAMADQTAAGLVVELAPAVPVVVLVLV